MGTLSALVPTTEQLLVRVMAARLYDEARRETWPGRPGPRVCRRACLAVAAIAPELPPERLALLVRYVIWSIFLDDQLDGPDADPVALDRIRHAVAAVTAGHRADPADPLTSVLIGILDELSEYDHTGAALARFGEALRNAVASGIEHALLGRAVPSGEARPPTATQYLDVAARTVNYHSFVYALLIVGTGSLTGSALDRLSPALRNAARAVRLVNDLRSVARDRAEETLNILSLRTADGMPVTRQQVAQEIDRLRQAHDHALPPLTDHVLAGPARALTRSLQFSIGLYQRTDLR